MPHGVDPHNHMPVRHMAEGPAAAPGSTVPVVDGQGRYEAPTLQQLQIWHHMNAERTPPASLVQDSVQRPIALRPAENIQLARLYQARHLLTLAKAVPGLPERVDVALRLPTGAVNRAIQNLLNGQDESSDRRCHPRPRDEILTHHKRPREQRSSGGGGGGGSGDYPRHTTLMHTNLDPKWMCFDCGGEQICMSGLQEKMEMNLPRLANTFQSSMS